MVASFYLSMYSSKQHNCILFKCNKVDKNHGPVTDLRFCLLCADHVKFHETQCFQKQCIFILRTQIFFKSCVLKRLEKAELTDDCYTNGMKHKCIDQNYIFLIYLIEKACLWMSEIHTALRKKYLDGVEIILTTYVEYKIIF